jgi:hypothetical protein
MDFRAPDGEQEAVNDPACLILILDNEDLDVAKQAFLGRGREHRTHPGAEPSAASMVSKTFSR